MRGLKKNTLQKEGRLRSEISERAVDVEKRGKRTFLQEVERKRRRKIHKRMSREKGDDEDVQKKI